MCLFRVILFKPIDFIKAKVSPGESGSFNSSKATTLPFTSLGFIISKHFNVGSKTCTVSIKQMANRVKRNINNLKLEWYGNKDTRSYNVSFNKIEKIGFKIKYDLDYGIKEIIKELKKSKKNSKSIKTITLEWYKLLEELSPYILKSQINNKMVKKF